MTGSKSAVKTVLLSGAVLLMIGGSASAQSPRRDPTADATAMTGHLTPDEVGLPPVTGVSTTDYVTRAAASDLYEVTAGQIAEDKAKRKDVRGFAHEMVLSHEKLAATLMAALDNAQRHIAKPSDQLPPALQAMIDQLNNTPRGVAFDDLYVAQQMEAHKKAWALQKGYSMDGDDPALRLVAAQAVPVIESHLGMLRTLKIEQQQ